MTEHQAWLRCAKAYATPEDERTDEQVDLAGDGICSALDMLFDLDAVILTAMLTKIAESMPPDSISIFCGPGGEYFCPVGLMYDTHRALYCYAMYYSNGAN